MAKKATKATKVTKLKILAESPEIAEAINEATSGAEDDLSGKVETPTPKVPTPKVPTPKVPTPKPTLATAVTTDTAKPERKPKVPKIDIIRGRMPLVLVFSIKFLENGTTGEIASKYRTTVGKVDDIKKEANFGYVKETFKPTMDMIKAAVPRCKELEAGKEILKAIQDVGIATPEDTIAFDAIKAAVRKKAPKAPKALEVEPIKPTNSIINEDDESVLAKLQEQTDANVGLLQKDKIDPEELANEVDQEDKDLMDLLS